MISDLDVLKHVLVKDFNNFIDRPVSNIPCQPRENFCMQRGEPDLRLVTPVVLSAWSPDPITSFIGLSADLTEFIIISVALSGHHSVETEGASSEQRRNLESTQTPSITNILQCQDEDGTMYVYIICNIVAYGWQSLDGATSEEKC